MVDKHEQECPVCIDGFRATCCCKEIRKAQARALREAGNDLVMLAEMTEQEVMLFLHRRADRIERGEAGA